MHRCGLLLLFAVCVSLVYRINCQESPQGTCNVWADPHLVMFPNDPAQQSMRMSYWCQAPGRMLILKNKYIEIYVNVTQAPFWNENFEINFLAGPQTICTITHAQTSCNSPFVDVVTINSGLDILYAEADYLSVTVNSYLINSRSVYDIYITQSYHITQESSGLCVNKLPTCRLENAVNPLGKRRKRNLDKDQATNVCNEYMQQAYRTAKEEIGNIGSKMAEHARAACINDVFLSGSPLWGQSAIGYVVMDALKEANLKSPQRREALKRAIPSIEKAASRGLENSYRWTRPRQPIPI